MSEIKITKDSLENAILKDGNFVSGYVYGNNAYINASGYGAHAEGYAIDTYILADGCGAHAEGYAAPIGNYILAKGDGAHAEGQNTAALGIASHAGGIGTIANSSAMTAIGKYNNTSVGRIGGDYLFVVGNGTSSATASRSNAFAVTTNGITASMLNLSGGKYQEETDPDDEPGGKIAWSDGNCYIQETTRDELTICANAGLYLKSDGNVNINTNTIIDGMATAKVNNVSDVYLGCPIGTVVMWAGRMDDEVPAGNLPYGWLLCNGDPIYISDNQPIIPYGDQIDIGGRTFYSTDISDLQALVNVIGYTFSGTSGVEVRLPDLQQKFPLGAQTNGTIGKYWTDDTPKTISAWSTDLGQIGGEDTNTLDVSEMPKHAHDLYGAGSGSGGIAPWIREITTTSRHPGFITENGGGQSHNNIPPFLAINFIIKYK